MSKKAMDKHLDKIGKSTTFLHNRGYFQANCKVQRNYREIKNKL